MKKMPLIFLSAILLGGCRTVRTATQSTDTVRVAVHDTAWLTRTSTFGLHADTLVAAFEADSVRTSAGTVLYAPRLSRRAVRPQITSADTVATARGTSLALRGTHAAASEKEKRAPRPWLTILLAAALAVSLVWRR